MCAVHRTSCGARNLPPAPPLTRGNVSIRPGALYSVLKRVHDEWTDLPLWITENGIALHDYVGPDGRCHHPERIEYYAGHFGEAARAIRPGVPLEGYIVWSLMDNFEWADGYRMRFGLLYVDYPTQDAPCEEQRGLVRWRLDPTEEIKFAALH